MALTKIDDRGLTTPIDLLDNEKIRFGTGNDLEVYFDGTHSKIVHTPGSGNVYLATDSLILSNAAMSEYYLTGTANGAVELNYDNTKRFETVSDGTKITGNVTVTTGNSILTNSSQGQLTIKGGASYPGGAIKFAGGQSGATDQGTSIFYAGEATSLEERLRITKDGKVRVPDNGKFVAGAGDDLQIYHDGTDSIISHQGGSGGDLIIQTGSSDDDVFIKCNDDFIVNVQGGAENAIIARNNGTVELYYDGTKQCETNSGGMNWADGKRAYFGNSSDLQIYHDGTHSYISNTTGNIRIWSSGSSEAISIIADGAVNLSHGNAVKLYTTSTGICVDASIAIGANAAANTINVSGTAGSSQTTLYYGFGTIDLTSASDERVKDNVVPTAKGLDEILKLPIVDFTYTPEYSDDSTTVRTGGIAQEWQKIDPNLVNDEDKDLLFINYKETIPLLIKAVQELSAEVEALKAK